MCPRHSAATFTTLTAATCGVLTGFMGSRPADLGHGQSYPGPGGGVNGEFRQTVGATGRRGYMPGRHASGMCSMRGVPRVMSTAIASKR